MPRYVLSMPHEVGGDGKPKAGIECNDSGEITAIVGSGTYAENLRDALKDDPVPAQEFVRRLTKSGYTEARLVDEFPEELNA